LKEEAGVNLSNDLQQQFGRRKGAVLPDPMKTLYAVIASHRGSNGMNLIDRF
jgi:hypothetical protein